jgi:DNA-binding MarR family transcriptional regulator
MSRDPFPDPPDRWGRDQQFPSVQPGAPSRNSSRAADPCSQEPEHSPRDYSKTSALTRDVERAYYLQSRAYLLRESEFSSLVEIGKFRVVDQTDLVEFAYAGDTSRAARDLRRLEKQGLVARKQAQEPKGRLHVIVLTRKGKRLLRTSGRLPERQAIYQGLVKPRELTHNAALYRLYQREAERIRHSGGTPLRVVLEYELQRDIYRKLAQLGEKVDRGEREEIARDHGLVLLHDKIPIPDLRIEYETTDHERKQIDLELATRNYRPGALTEKAKAGFSIYAPREDASKLRRILDESELTARIFAL